METGYTIEQAASALRVSTKSIRNYIKKGILLAELVNGKYIISLESIRYFPGGSRKSLQANLSSSSTVQVEISYLEGLLTRNAQLEAQAQAAIEYKARVADLEELLKKERSRGFWSRLLNR